MSKLFLGAVAVAALATPALAGGNAHRHYNHDLARPTGNQIVVSCYRGPWEDVIWDRPNPVFVDSLVSVGYTFATAHAIAERVCRDQTLVNNPGAMKTTMEQIWYDAASHRSHNF